MQATQKNACGGSCGQLHSDLIVVGRDSFLGLFHEALLLFLERFLPEIAIRESRLRAGPRRL